MRFNAHSEVPYFSVGYLQERVLELHGSCQPAAAVGHIFLVGSVDRDDGYDIVICIPAKRWFISWSADR